MSADLAGALRYAPAGPRGRPSGSFPAAAFASPARLVSARNRLGEENVNHPPASQSSQFAAPTVGAAAVSDSLAPFAPAAADRATWMRHLEPVELAAGAVLFRQGEPAEFLCFVESGELAVVLEVPGAGRVPVRRFGPGQCLGEMALYRREARAATVEALAPSRLWRLGTAQLAAIEREAPALALAMHRHVAGLLAERVAFANTELKDPLARLAHAIRGLAASRFGETEWDRAALAVAARRGDEVGAVASALDHLVAQLGSYLEELKTATARREAVESELRIAGEIQASFLPPAPPSAVVPAAGAGPAGAVPARVDFSARMKPAREAGGDLYDGFFLPDGRFLCVVGDVSGKGVSAALFMAVTATGLRALAPGAAEPGELITRLNRLLCERNDTLQFVTVFAAILDPASGELVWTNAGHPPPFVLRADGGLERLDGARATPLAVFENHAYATHRARLAPGDTLLMFTDGVTEAMDARQALYGDERLAALLAARPGREAAGALVEAVLADVLAYEAGCPQADDITLAALRLPAAG